MQMGMAVGEEAIGVSMTGRLRTKRAKGGYALQACGGGGLLGGPCMGHAWFMRRD